MHKFFRQKRSWIGIIGFALILLSSLLAEILSNSQPIYLSRDGKIYFPILKKIPATEFGITDSFVVDYRALVKADETAGLPTRAVFPLNRWDPFEQTADGLLPPSDKHLFGTDSLGRDVLARLIYGIRVSVIYGILFWLASASIGVMIGAIQGYFAGKFDFVTERIKELIEVLPFLSVVILINGMMRADSFWLTLGVVVALSWIGIASQVRAQFLSLRKREFCEAARAAGATPSRIIFRHILPNAMTPILTMTPFLISGGIATLTVLDYLGFGLSPPTPSLGQLLQEGRTYIQKAPWLLVAPTLALCWMLISINLIGESLRSAFDPKSK